MKRIFIVFLLIIFSSSFSFVQSNEKITVKDVEDLLDPKEIYKIDLFLLNSRMPYNDYHYSLLDSSYYQKKFQDSYKKRLQTRGLAKCMYGKDLKDNRNKNSIPGSNKKCKLQVIRSVLSYSEKSKKKRPGDIFFAFDAIEHFIYNKKERAKFIKTTNKRWVEINQKFLPGMLCGKSAIPDAANCYIFKKSTSKKIERFKKDPSNEKVLGHSLIKYIERVKMISNAREKLVGNGSYALLGDMLNATVGDVKKNNISPALQKRRALLNKYSLVMHGIKKKLNEGKYKSIDKDVYKLSKNYEALKALTTTTNNTVINIDKAISIIFDTNKLVQSSALSTKDNEEEKLLALSSIYFMQYLLDSILNTIPEKYYAETRGLPQNLFSEFDLDQLENIIDTITNKNQEIKSEELAKSMGIINNYINASKVIKELNNLGIKNNLNKNFTHNEIAQTVDQELRKNLDQEIFNDVRKLLQEVDQNELSNLTKEASGIAKEVSKEASGIAKEVSKEVSKTTTYNSVLDHKFGGQSLRRLIAISRR